MSEGALYQPILAFDTATRHCSIALTSGGMHNGAVLGSVVLASELSHSRRLLGAVEWLLAEVGLSFAEIAAIAVGLGPGSFTGLRIGMATAKGLCHGTGKPLLGVSSLDAIGCALDTGALVGVVFDARKQEVYSRWYRRGTDGIVAGLGEPWVGRPERLPLPPDEPTDSVLLAGDGAVAYQAVFRERFGAGMHLASARYHYPSAEIIGLLAARLLTEGRVLDLAEVVPLYVRLSDAQLSLVVPATTAGSEEP